MKIPRFRRVVPIAVISVYLVLAAHLVGDTTTVTAIFSYGTPWLLVGVASVVLLLLLHSSWKWTVLPPLVFALHGGMRSFDASAPPPPEPSFRAMTWNAGRNLANHPEHWHFDPEVVTIVEAGNLSAVWNEFVASTPGYEWRKLDTGMLLGVRGEILESSDFGVHDRYRCSRVMIRLHQGIELDVLAVDIRSQPWLSKREPLHAIFEVIPQDRPTLIMGDFNTPLESRLLRHAAEGRFQNANRVNHRGFRETWPWQLPLLTLDQIWASREMTPLECATEQKHSDHLAVIARLRLPGELP